MYRGKYLSVLHRAASSAGQKTTGIDIFQVAPLALTSADLERELGPQSDLILLERDSSTYSPEELNAVVGGPAS